jgi:energy-coupling factor transporter transmembrane protein EcfT
VRSGAALALLASAVAAALLARHSVSVATIAIVLLLVCLRAPRARRWPYLLGTTFSAFTLFAVTPFVETLGSHPLWTGPIVPVLGQLDVTREELASAAFNAFRLASVGFGFAAYALLLDHDRLLSAAGVARRSVLAVALATRLLPILERDATGLVESLRGRGVAALNIAEAMEARGYGRPQRTRSPTPEWRTHDRLALLVGAAIVAAGALWL